jgi:pyruvate kinase
MINRTKIVATLGPSSRELPVIRSLIQAGMDVARLNFSHGTHEEHAQTYHLLRQTAREMGRPISIFQDLQGPKIRTGEIEHGAVNIEAGQKVRLTPQPLPGNVKNIPVDFPEFLESATLGHRILLDDGNLELLITDVTEDHVEAEVILGGLLKSHKGVNLPGAKINIPGFTKNDEEDLAFGLELGVDAVAVSFVRTQEDIQSVRSAIQRLAPHRRDLPIIAKLERPEALDNLDEIVLAADGVMVARGDLGVEMSPEAVPIAQKRIIECANKHARFVITATQMLDSMISNPRPTRAEASDVANAIFDGTDAVMLSGETASGKYPVQAVQMMSAISSQAEAHLAEWGRWQGMVVSGQCDDDTYFMTQAARELAHDRNVAAIATFTVSGRTARILSKLRPGVPIFAFTPHEVVYNRLNLYWGVRPFLVEHAETIARMIQVVEKALLDSDASNPGQQVVMICGYPISAIRHTNMALLHTIGESTS